MLLLMARSGERGGMPPPTPLLSAKDALRELDPTLLPLLRGEGDRIDGTAVDTGCCCCSRGGPGCGAKWPASTTTTIVVEGDVDGASIEPRPPFPPRWALEVQPPTTTDARDLRRSILEKRERGDGALLRVGGGAESETPATVSAVFFRKMKKKIEEPKVGSHSFSSFLFWANSLSLDLSLSLSLSPSLFSRTA